MGKRSESEFAEVPVDRFILESFANERSAYFGSDAMQDKASSLDKFRNRVKWHINNSLSARQKQVIHAYLAGQKEREIALSLGITQQVVNIYKHRAIKKLHRVLSA